MRVIEGIRRAWRDHVAGPQLRTYDMACEELGGAPWRARPDATDRWFIANRAEAPMDHQSTIDTGVISLKPTMRRTTKLLVAGAIGLAGVGLVAVLSSGGAAVQPAHAPAAAVEASSAVAAPAPAAPAMDTVATPRAPAVAPAPTAPTARTVVAPPLTPHAHAHPHTRAHGQAPARRHHVARHRRR